MAFDFAASLAAEQGLGSYLVKRFILSPEQWSDYSNPQVLDWQVVKFDSANKAAVPSEYGVYSFVVDPEVCGHPATNYMMYIGRARGVSLRKRYGEYLAEKSADKGRPHVQQLLNKWDGHLWFHYAVVDDVAVIDALEEDLIVAYLPPFNRSFPAKISRVIRTVFQ